MVIIGLQSELINSDRRWLWQLRGAGRAAKERDSRVDEHAEGVAVRAHQEPVPDQGREDHAGHHHQDDADAGVDVVRQRAAPAEEGKQDAVVAAEQNRQRGRRRRRRR